MLDEPFGALDAFTREELWVVLHDLWAARCFTVILVTHDLREAAFLSDTVFVMSNRPGRIIARRDIPRNGPRRIEETYTPDFAAVVHELRELVLTPYYKANGLSSVTPERMRKSMQLIYDAYGIKTPPAVEKVYTDRFLPPRADRMPPAL
jgi:ABC-type proline/glycine betaine transport system ATPase subunit